MLGNKFCHPVENTGSGEHAEHGHQLAEVTRLADA